MHFNILALALLAGLTAAAPKKAPPKQPAPAPSSTMCYTRMASTKAKGKPKTSWYTSYTQCTSTSTSTTTVTSTPDPDTTTTTVLTTSTTTGPTSLDTSTVTTTSTETDTDTTTTTDTSTSTTTTSVTFTSTVTAPDAFIPIQTSLPGSTYDGADGQPPAKKRDAAVDVKVDTGKTPLLSVFDTSDPSKHQYNQGVTCQKWMNKGKCATTVTTTTITVTASTPTSTSTTTSTITTTEIPSATTTTTVTVPTTTTTTSTTSTVTTSTSTETTTIATATSPVYGACATNNFASQYLGQDIGAIYLDSPFALSLSYPTAGTAYDCCVAAINAPSELNVGAWHFYTPEAQCILIEQTQCPAQASSPYTPYLGSPRSTIGNANCGVVVPA